MKAQYELLLKERRCWRTMKECPLSENVLKELYSWSEDNPLHPFLVLKICDPCDYENKFPKTTN